MDVMVFLSEQWLLVCILVALVAALVAVEGKRGGKALSLHGVTMLVNRGEGIILDIREAKDYKSGHIVDSIHIPYQKLASRLVELEKHKSKTVVVVDKMGQTTGAAVKVLTENGYTANRMQGGMTEWMGQNLPVIKG